MNKKNFFWNMAGSLCNAFSSMILLIVVNRVNNAYDGGIFSLGFATAQMMTTIGTLEVRNYQSSDINEEFSFNDYFSFRIFTCSIMIIFSVFYVFANGFSLEKIVLTILLCLYKTVEAFFDVFEGFYQQKDRIDYSGKSLFFRVIISTAVFILVLIGTHNLALSVSFMFLSALIFSIIYNKYITEKNWTKFHFVYQKDKWKKLLLNCLPLATGAFIILYMGNAPKYAVDEKLGPELQNIFSIIFMPAFVVNLFSLFAFRPMLTSLAREWNSNNLKGFLTILVKAFIWLIMITIVCLSGAYLLGVPVLSILYKVDLSAYKIDLILIMIGGSINAFSTILRFTLTVIRKHISSLWGYLIALLFTVCFCPYLVEKNALFGASLSYILSMTVLSIVFLVILIKVVVRKKVNQF